MVVDIKILNSFPKGVIVTPEPLLWLYKNIKNTTDVDNLYAIGFKYDDDSIQFGLTGTLETNESPTDGMVREISEECGLLVEPQNLFQMKTKKKERIIQTWWVQSYPIDTIKKIFIRDDSKGKDVKSKKIGTIIYGTKRQLYEKLKSVIELGLHSSDSIKSMLIFPLQWFERVKIYNFIINKN